MTAMMGRPMHSLFSSGSTVAPAPSRHGRPVLWIALAILACGIAVAGWLTGKREQPLRIEAPLEQSVRKAEKSEVMMATLRIDADAPGARIVVDGRAVGVVPRTIDGVMPGRHRVRVDAVDRIPWEREVNLISGETQRIHARLAATPPRLRVESDVPGAMVFLDRRYLGKTPLTAREITRGSHRLDVSVEGHEVHSETVDLDAGERTVMVRFRQMLLNERLAVVHRHGIGSCEGELIATLQGLRYESSNREHSFSATLDAIERFEVDYLKKNLHVRLRGGRKFNFTIRNESADPLLVFHREVERARSFLARKYTSE